MKNFKTKFYPLFVSAFFLITACGPTIHYIGDQYAAVENVDVYYSERDVKQPYRTIGKMTNDNILDYRAESIQRSMLATAKTRGADAIIFHGLDNNRAVTDGNDTRLSVYADLIKYE